jgi:hypothetical protein
MSDATPRIAVLFSARPALWRIDKNITAESNSCDL